MACETTSESSFAAEYIFATGTMTTAAGSSAAEGTPVKARSNSREPFADRRNSDRTPRSGFGARGTSRNREPQWKSGTSPLWSRSFSASSEERHTIRIISQLAVHAIKVSHLRLTGHGDGGVIAPSSWTD